ncbi:MAG: hypothetical protein FD134_1861 [Gallionellaceae bacterium]|nr:MAG: hypothetical protein FD134_1861 [Gallionellaceae bacterium]
MKRIPEAGLTGDALREAAAGELGAIVNLVRQALAAKLYPGQADNRYVGVAAFYADRAVVERDGRLYAYPYAISDANQVTLGEPQEVVQNHQPVALREAAFIEARGDASSGRWLIRVIKAGLSGNGNFYPDAALREAAPLFDNTRVFIKSDAEHVKGDGKAVANLIGRLAEAKFVPGALPDTGEITAVLEFIEPEGEVAVKVREAHQRGMADLFGFSIDANATAKTAVRAGKKVREAGKITRVNSVDLIVEPGAGGQLIRVAESLNPEKEQDTMRIRMLEAIHKKNPSKFAGMKPEDIADDELEAAYREAVAPASAAAADHGKGNDVAEQIRMIEARANMRVAISGSTLPQPAKDRLLADFAARERFAEADVDAALKSEREYLARFTESGKPVINFGDTARVEDRSIKVGDMLDAFFDPAHKDHRNVHSFKECYVEITGDTRVTGRMENCDQSRLRESAGASFRESVDSTSFANVLGSSLTRRMVAEYIAATDYQAWRQIATTTPVNDFRTQERTRFGGYGDLPAVAESDPYAALASPTDEKATYGVTKRGGTEDITLEMIKNDDVGSIQRIPSKLGRAAQRTLAKFVFDFIRTNPAIYDTVALFHANHGNLGSAALDATSLAAGRLAMLKQAEKDSADRLGIGPKSLLVPVDLQEAAVNLFYRNTNLDKTFIQTTSLNVIPVWYWTDATDWALAADPRDIPTIEIGFLDGREEPELFVQDMPNVGSMFSNDKLTYKMRHIYGGNVLDYRGLYKAVVAG